MNTDHFLAAMSEPHAPAWPTPKRPVQCPASNSDARKRDAEREAQS